MITESEYDYGMFKDMLDWSEQIKKRQTCKIINTECGKECYKTDREIELEKKLEIAVEAINSAAEYLACMEDLSKLNDGKCNEQMALEALNEALAKIKEIK